jgi:hypothetical protein
MADDIRELLFPYGGLSLVQPAYLKGNPGTCEVAENVVYFDVFEGRARGGSRSGLVRFIDEQVSGENEIQHIGGIVTVDGEMIDWSFDGPNQRFPGIYAGIGFIDFDFVPLQFPAFITTADDGNDGSDGGPVSETFSEASGYPTVKDKNQKIVARLVSEDYEVSLNTNVQLTATLRDRSGGFLSAAALNGKNIYLRTDPPGKQGDGDFGSAGGSEMTPFVQDSVAGVVYYRVEVITVLGNIVARSNTIHIKYGQLTTTINWSNPASIEEGTALSATQLNATASAPGFPGVPGTFTYDPISGTVLSLGVHVLSVTFVPTDTATYSTPPPKTVSITVTEVGGGNPDVPVVNVSLDAFGNIVGATPVLEIAPIPPNNQPDLDLADELVGLPTSVFVLAEFFYEGEFVGASWNWGTNRWEL